MKILLIGLTLLASISSFAVTLQSNFILCTGGERSLVVDVKDKHGNIKEYEVVVFEDMATASKALQVCNNMKDTYEIREIPRAYQGTEFRALYDLDHKEFIGYYWFEADKIFDLPDPSLESLREQAAELILHKIL